MRSVFLLPAVVCVAVVVLPGCGSGKGNGEGDSGDGESEFGAGSGSEFDGDGPVASDGRIWCQAGSDSSGSFAYIECKYDDPQGPADVQEGILIATRASDGSAVWEKEAQFVCRDYKCEGSFGETQSGYAPVNCTQLGDFVFEAVLVDRSGNESAPLVLTQER